MNDNEIRSNEENMIDSDNVQTDAKKEDDKKSHKVRNTIITIIVIIIIILLLLRSCGRGSEPVDTTPTELTTRETIGFNDSGEEVETVAPETQESVTVNYTLNSVVTISNGKISGLGLENNNEHRYVRAVYKLADNIVYDSKLIEVNGMIDVDSIEAGVTLPAPGEYDTIVEMYSYDFDQNMRGQTNFEVTIIVE